MGSKPRWLTCGILAAVQIACSPAPDIADPDASFGQAEELRLASKEDASRQAIPIYRDVRAAWIRAGDSARAATASQKLGATYKSLGLLDEALREYLEAASLCGDTCDPLLESAIWSDIGLLEAMLADSDASQRAAHERCQHALELAREAGGRREEAEALGCAAEVEYHRGNLDEAVGLYESAKPLWETLADPHGRAEALFNEGSVRSDLSQFSEAREDLEQALSLWTSTNDEHGEGKALVGLGRLEHRQGNYQDALNRFTRALELLEPTGDLVWQASGLGGMGAVHLDLGDAERALSYWEATLEPMRKTGLRTATWDLLLAVGATQLRLDQPAEALERFEEGLTVAEEKQGDAWKQAYALHFMSQAHQSLGNPAASLECLERALSMQRDRSDPRLEAAIRADLGRAYELLERPAAAGEHFSRALELSEASGDKVSQAAALFGMARSARSQDDLDAARDYIERSLNVTESLREGVESVELRTSYFASIYRLHEQYIDVLMRLHDARPREGLAATAFAASERARARSLLESLTEADVDIRAGVDPSLLERESSLKGRLDASVERRLVLRDETEAAALDEQIRDLQADYDLLVAEIRSKSPRYASLTRPAPLDLEKVQEMLLDDDTLLLEYALGEERSFLWAVSKREYTSFELGPRAEIERNAERLYELLTARARVVSESLQERNRRLERADRESSEVSARLSDLLLAPVAETIAGKRLLVVADGALQYVPFGALPAPGGGADAAPMIVEHEIVSLPSASALAVLREQTRGRQAPSRTVAVFADPVYAPDDPRLDREPAPSPDIHADASHALRDIGLFGSGDLRIPRLGATRQEAAAIVAAAPAGTTLEAVDFDAARGTVMSAELSRYRIVHFASHGISSSENLAMSGILLSMYDDHGQAVDGFLRLHDIYDLDLAAELVVLSACNTALGKELRGEGVVGLVRAFMYAGAERVVASLWKVDDDATRELMSRFYREMLEAERSPAAALRNAQLAMWRDTEWQSPFYWGAFVLQGEWQ